VCSGTMTWMEKSTSSCALGTSWLSRQPFPHSRSYETGNVSRIFKVGFTAARDNEFTFSRSHFPIFDFPINAPVRVTRSETTNKRRFYVACKCTRAGREWQVRAIYYSICPESVVLSNANMAWEVIAVIIFQGLGMGESTKVRCENRNGDDNETSAGRPVVGAVKYQRTREFSREVNCTLGKELRGG